MNAVERRGEEEEPVVEKKSTCRSQTGNWGLASSARALLLQQGATPPLETGTVRQSRKERSMERVMSALKSEKLAIPLGVSIMV
ncbi:hypothetical protein V6N12_011572 [Hibiscus sabdariffa]|uniref:Uncharacterized protein n=1 Tax=Hibiscus sabdariffa TaxID=183260 RepID=A0ABR2AZ21_9ROSI